MYKWVDEEHLGMRACSPSCRRGSPFTSGVAPIDLRCTTIYASSPSLLSLQDKDYLLTSSCNESSCRQASVIYGIRFDLPNNIRTIG